VAIGKELPRRAYHKYDSHYLGLTIGTDAPTHAVVLAAVANTC
jgi:hypothetical protein